MPNFKVFHKDSLGDDFININASDAEHAAELFVEGNDFRNADGITELTEVTVVDSIGKSTLYEVSGEVDYVYNYSAREKEVSNG